MPPTNTLRYDVLISDPIPSAPSGLVPDGTRGAFSPLSTTVVTSGSSAVLIDPPMTSDQAGPVLRWLSRRDLTLTHVIATHGHGDHWFTAETIATAHDAAVVATAGTIAQMAVNIAARPHFWDALFPGQIPETNVTATTPPDNTITLDGHAIRLVDVGHSDTDDTSIVHVPDLDLVVAGDVTYNGVHQYLVESGGDGRSRWREAIDVVAALRPGRIVSGHKNKAFDDAAQRQIDATRAYLDDVDDLFAHLDDPVSFFTGMVDRHPQRLNTSALWVGARALYAARRAPSSSDQPSRPAVV
jgi:glyoxylase-like metal-dependent hydrolase (beta-lactamase superfamily II)